MITVFCETLKPIGRKRVFFGLKTRVLTRFYEWFWQPW